MWDSPSLWWSLTAPWLWQLETAGLELLKYVLAHTTDMGSLLDRNAPKEGGLRWNLIVSVGGGSTIKILIIWFNKQNVVTDYAFKHS